MFSISAINSCVPAMWMFPQNHSYPEPNDHTCEQFIQARGFLQGAVQQRSSLDSSLPGDQVHTELAITFPNPLLEAKGREMWVKFTTIVCFKSLNCVPFLKFVYGLHPVYRTCRRLEGDTDWEGDDEQRSICRMSSVTLERFLQDSSSRWIFLLSRLFFHPFVASIPLNPAKST